MSFRFTRDVLKISAGQICQNIGWHAVQSSPMDILIDVTHRHLREICKAIHSYSNQYNRTEPNLDDVALAFTDLNINLQDIEEYVSNVEPVPFPHKVPAFPVNHSSNLQIPNPVSRELSYRPEHIPTYLPLMHPDLEEEDGLLSPVLENGQKKNSMEGSGATAEGESTSPLNSPKHGTKRPSEWSNDIPVSKKPRHYTEEEGRPMREMTSVFMTPTGFISPAREGRAPDPTLPNTFDSPPSTPEPPPPETLPVKKESKSKDSKKDKSSKSKKDKDSSSKKDSKKIKTSKKENKENTAFSSEKSVVPSSSSKKEHTSSHKSDRKGEKSSTKSSVKSSDASHTKIKIEKIKHKEGRDEHKKSKDHSKSSKSKSKMKHGSSSKSLKSSKSPKSPEKSTIKSPKKSSSKSPKVEKKPHLNIAVPPPIVTPVLPPSPPPLPLMAFVKKELDEVTEELKEPKVEYETNDALSNDYDEFIDSREESPEPRLVIDDSLETQVRQERESRLALFDQSINSVIQKCQEESEIQTVKSHKAVDDVINAVARGPMMRKFEAKDIYDFTDSSELSSLSSLEPGDVDDDDSSIDVPMIKKEKAKTPESEMSFENPKKSKLKDKQSKKSKGLKSKSSGSLKSPQSQKSPNVIVKREERSPSRIRLKDDIFSSDASSLSPSPSPPPSFSEFPSQRNGPSSMSDFQQASPFTHSPSVPSTSFSSSPFAPIPPMPCHMQANPHFPTPPLFVSTKSDPDAFPEMSSPQPLNLAKSSSSSFSKGASESKVSESHRSKSEDLVDTAKKSGTYVEKEKSKLHRKDKKDKEKKLKTKRKSKEPKEKSKPPKVKLESAKEKEKPKEVVKEMPKESPPKAKPEKVVKKRGRPEKKKNKNKAQKNNDDSVTKLTLKFAGGSSGSTQFVIKPSSKRLSSPPSSSPGREDRSLSPDRIPTPPPVESPSPPPPVRQPSPPPVMINFEPPVEESPPAAAKAPTRGRGRGRKPAVQPPAPPPPARTVITETLGTIVDEQGNKIWICPACTRPDDGSPMIGCDECDDWYHWVCVGIVVPPKEEESWYCTRCIAKRQSAPSKKGRKKHKKGK